MRTLATHRQTSRKQRPGDERGPLTGLARGPRLGQAMPGDPMNTVLLAASLMVSASLMESAAHAEEGWDLGDLGLVADLPAGWTVPEGGWADWQLKAKHTDGRVLQVWSTPWQVPMDDAAAVAFETLYADQLATEAKATITSRKHETAKIGGRRSVRVTLGLDVKGGEGVAELVAFEGPGRTIHVRSVGNARRSKALRDDLTAFVEAFKVTKGPLDTGTKTVTGAGFSTTLPDGWRVPLEPELEKTRALLEAVGAELKPDACVAGVRPAPVGDPQVVLVCPSSMRVGILDEHSFEAVEAELHTKLFGRSEANGVAVPPAEQVQVGDRVGLYYRPPAAKLAVRMVLAPMGTDMVQAWGLAPVDQGADLDAAMMQMLPGVSFTGDGGGAHVVGIDKKVAYYVQHRPTSPLVWGPLGLVVLLGLGGVVLGRKKPVVEDD